MQESTNQIRCRAVFTFILGIVVGVLLMGIGMFIGYNTLKHSIAHKTILTGLYLTIAFILFP